MGRSRLRGVRSALPGDAPRRLRTGAAAGDGRALGGGAAQQLPLSRTGERGMSEGTPPEAVRDLQRRAAELRRFVEDAVTGDDPRGVRPLAPDRSDLPDLFDRLERRTTTSVWNMQRSLGFEPEDRTPALNERSRRRGLEMRMLVAPVARRFNPLLPCVSPEVRVGPVPLPLMVIDQRVAVLEGRRRRPARSRSSWSPTARRFGGRSTSSGSPRSTPSPGTRASVHRRPPGSTTSPATSRRGSRTTPSSGPCESRGAPWSPRSRLSCASWVHAAASRRGR